MFWIILHTHRHGVDIFPVSSDNQPSNEAAIKFINSVSSYEEDREEYIDIDGPYKFDTLPTIKED